MSHAHSPATRASSSYQSIDLENCSDLRIVDFIYLLFRVKFIM